MKIPHSTVDKQQTNKPSKYTLCSEQTELNKTFNTSYARCK